MNRIVYLDQNLQIDLLEHCQVTGMKNGDKALPSIILARRGLLVKMIIILEPHHDYILIKFCILKHFKIVETLVCKTVTMVCEDKSGRSWSFAHNSMGQSYKQAFTPRVIKWPSFPIPSKYGVLSLSESKIRVTSLGVSSANMHSSKDFLCYCYALFKCSLLPPLNTHDVIY